MQVVVEGEVGPERMEHHQDPRGHFQLVRRQREERILHGAEQQAQCIPLVLVHDPPKVMRQRENEVEVRDPGDHFRLALRDPALFFQMSAARAVPVPAGAGAHFDTAAFPAADQGIA